jgi:hypothetical protein
LGQSKIATVIVAVIDITTWKGRTFAPVFRPTFDIKIWSAQKAENIITLKNGDVESVFIGFLLNYAGYLI